MKTCIIIPAYNEEVLIGNTLQSFVDQTLLPHRLIVVNDGSTDKTSEIVTAFSKKHHWIHLVNNPKKEKRASGSKVIRAFLLGYDSFKTHDYDIIAKFDADLTFPGNYLETIVSIFKKNPETGLAGGVCSIEKNGNWQVEKITGDDHVRGALKAYRKACFEDIGKLRPVMGWDSLDEYLARFHGWNVAVEPSLVVKQHRTTNSLSNWQQIQLKNGRAFYQLRMGFWISLISSLKRGIKFKPFIISGLLSFWGFLRSAIKRESFMVSKEEGKFIRQYRKNKMLSKLRNILGA